MKYRKIDFKASNTDKEVKLILKQIAIWHNMTPKLWRPNYKATEADIEQTMDRILNTKHEDLFIAISEDDKGNIQGFIWANKEAEARDTVEILSLYVTEDFRQCGIATNLKALLEEWCRLEGIEYIDTSVHYKNSNMLVLNQKLGYIPGMVRMTKKLI